MESEKLLPCPNPWCDCPDDLFVQPLDKKTLFGVQCGCGFEGPVLGTEVKAIAAWNTRAPADLRSALEAVQDAFNEAFNEHGASGYGRDTATQKKVTEVLAGLEKAVLAALAPTKGDVS